MGKKKKKKKHGTVKDSFCIDDLLDKVKKRKKKLKEKKQGIVYEQEET